MSCIALHRGSQKPLQQQQRRRQTAACAHRWRQSSSCSRSRSSNSSKGGWFRTNSLARALGWREETLDWALRCSLRQSMSAAGASRVEQRWLRAHGRTGSYIFSPPPLFSLREGTDRRSWAPRSSGARASHPARVRQASRCSGGREAGWRKSRFKSQDATTLLPHSTLFSSSSSFFFFLYFCLDAVRGHYVKGGARKR